MPSMPAHRLLAVVIAAIGLPTASLARADDEGIKIGEGRLHPYLNLDGKWDSFASVSTTGSALSDFLFDIDPGLNLHIPSRVLSFGLDGDFDEVLYAQYTVLNRSLANGALSLDFFDRGVVGLTLSDHFNRQNNATVSVLPFAVISDLNVASAAVPIRPGGGAMVITPAYSFTYQHFEGFDVGMIAVAACPGDSPYCDASKASELDYTEQRGALDVVWRFLPKTAALLSGEFLNVAYNSSAKNTGNAPLNLFDATLGLSGLITTHFAVVARAGYAQTFLTASDVTADMELKTAGGAPRRDWPAGAWIPLQRDRLHPHRLQPHAPAGAHRSGLLRGQSTLSADPVALRAPDPASRRQSGRRHLRLQHRADRQSNG